MKVCEICKCVVDTGEELKLVKMERFQSVGVIGYIHVRCLEEAIKRLDMQGDGK